MLWSRIKKSRILDIARKTFGPAWASARSKYKKPDLAQAMEEAFAAGERPVGIGKSEHAAALAWILPGFAAFDSGGPDADGAQAAEPPADGAHASADAKADPVPGGTDAAEAPAHDKGKGAPVHAEAEAGAEPVNGDGAPEEAPAEPAIAQAIDAINRVPTADGGPRAIVQIVGPVNGSDDPPPAGTGDEMPEVPEFLRGVH